jgi:hypothetical protein
MLGSGGVAFLVFALSAQIVYSASLVLFLTGTPTRLRLRAGWAALAVAVVMLIAAIAAAPDANPTAEPL